MRGSDADGVLASVPSRKASSWLSVAREERLGRLGSTTGLSVGGGAIWICGGFLERAVLTGRVVILAVTGRALGRDIGGSCWMNGVISGGRKGGWWWWGEGQEIIIKVQTMSAGTVHSGSKAQKLIHNVIYSIFDNCEKRYRDVYSMFFTD